MGIQILRDFVQQKQTALHLSELINGCILAVELFKRIIHDSRNSEIVSWSVINFGKLCSQLLEAIGCSKR